MDGPCTKWMKRKTVFRLIFVMACMALPGLSAKQGPDKETIRLMRAIEQFQQASSLYGEKKLDDAIAEYREALRDDPQEPYWHQALAKALEDKGDLQGALEEYRVASQQSPLDGGLRSKYEELQWKLQPNADNKPARTTTSRAEPFKPGAGVTAPTPTYKPEPPYSEKARKAKYQGWTVLWLVVDAEGNVAEARVVKPLGVGLDEQALETVRTWKFKPAKRGGVPIPVRVMVEVNFKLY